MAAPSTPSTQRAFDKALQLRNKRNNLSIRASTNYNTWAPKWSEANSNLINSLGVIGLNSVNRYLNGSLNNTNFKTNFNGSGYNVNALLAKLKKLKAKNTTVMINTARANYNSKLAAFNSKSNGHKEALNLVNAASRYKALYNLNKNNAIDVGCMFRDFRTSKPTNVVLLVTYVHDFGQLTKKK
jgi:hypothetical protein